MAAVISLLGPSIWTVTTAAEPSFDTPPVTWLPNGSVTAATWLVVLSWVTAFSTGPSMAASRTDIPVGATMTSCADVPLTCGNVWARRLSAIPDSVPGIEKVLFVPVLNRPAPTPTATMIATQVSSTRSRAPNAQWPRR